MNRISLKREKDTKVNRYSRISSVVIFVYVLFVLWGQYAMLDTIFPPLPIAAAIIAMAYVLTKICIRWMGGFTLEGDCGVPDIKEIKKIGIKAFAICMCVMLVAYYSRFPGIYFMDSVYQLNEAMTGVYDDWHPLLHTLLVYFLPIKLGGVWLIELLQLIFYSLALAYLICTLRWYGCKKSICTGVFVYLMLQPYTTYIILFPMKDCTFAILTMLLVTQYIHIVYTRGTWLNRNVNLILLIVTTVICTIVRHNAILFTLPFMCGVLVYSCKERKRGIIYMISVIICILLIKIPFYGLFHMEPNEDRVTETMGLPIVMMGNVLTSTPELMSDDAADFMYEIREKDIWEEYYRTGDWNIVKCYDGGANFDAIEQTGRAKILEYMTDTLVRCPDQSLRAFNSVTGMVWQIDGDMGWKYSMEKYDSNYVGSVYDDTEATEELDRYDVELPMADYISDCFRQYRDIVQGSVLKYVFSYIGVLNLLMIMCCFSKIRCKKDVKKIFHILPIITYSFGTALMLSAYDWRFFYYTYACFFGVMYLLLGDTENKAEPKKEEC